MGWCDAPGRALDSGNPAYDVYAKPLTAYVARFIGGQNVLGGRVSAVSNGMIVLDLPTHGRVEFAAADSGAADRFDPPRLRAS